VYLATLRRGNSWPKERVSISLHGWTLIQPFGRFLFDTLFTRCTSDPSLPVVFEMAGHSLHDDKGPTLLVLTCILTSLAVTTTSLRCWVRWGNRQLGLDDGAMAVTTVLAVVRMSIQIISVHYGNGKHRGYVSDHDYKIVNKLTWATQVLLFPTICLMKVSICVLILRIKDTRALRYILGAVITGLVLTNFECLLVLLAECSPLDAYWNGTSATHCWPAKVRIYSIYLQACTYSEIRSS
jgi:hypothetical protein